MHGNESLRFPQDFYEGMKKLQVIAFEKLEYPIVPTSFECSTNLRTLCLDGCSLMFELTCIGNLSNLEVLSFANSSITILPSTFRNLKKLRLLDVTGCYNLVIDDGLLRSLVKLEELYMRSCYGNACCFTDNNCSELAQRSENLCALEFEFIGNNAHLENMSYEKLKRLKLSVGCYFTEVLHWRHISQGETRSYQNSLNLITNRAELLKSKINELFKITDALYLQVNDMNTLEDVDMESPHPRHPPRCSSFYNLRSLEVTECADLRYLFTLNVATKLSKLEYLDISRCPIMEAVIHAENDRSDIIMFSNLKYLRLAELPKLLHFCNNIDVIGLPRLVELHLGGLQNFTSIYPSSASSSVSSNISRVQSFFHEEDATPMLEKLFVYYMENLKEIWPPQFSISNMYLLRELTVEVCGSIVVLFNMDFGEIEHLSSSLRSIQVLGCDSLVKLFSCNPFPFLNNLQELNIEGCGSIQVLFNTDLGRAGKSEEQVCSSSLRSIEVEYCDSLVNLLPSNPMPLFNNLEKIEVVDCASIEAIFDIDMGSVGEMDKVSSSRLRRIELYELEKLREVWRIKDAGNNLIHGFEAVESIYIRNCERFENLITPATTTFDMRALKEVRIHNCGGESGRNNELAKSNRDQEARLPSDTLLQLQKLEIVRFEDCEDTEEIFDSQTFAEIPNLRQVELKLLESLKYIGKSKHGIALKFPNLTRLSIILCNSLEYVFTCSIVGSLLQLQELLIGLCDRMKVIVKGEEEEECDAKVVFPCLKSLKLIHLISLEGFWLGKEAFEFPLLDTLEIHYCSKMTVFTNGDLSAPKLYAIDIGSRKYNIHNRLNSFLNISNKRD